MADSLLQHHAPQAQRSEKDTRSIGPALPADHRLFYTALCKRQISDLFYARQKIYLSQRPAPVKRHLPYRRQRVRKMNLL